MSEATPGQYECQPVHEMEFQFDGGRAPSGVVIEAIAAADGTDPSALPPLYDSVDPDALDRLFDGPAQKRPDRLVFGHAGWDVFVGDDGVITVCEPDEPVEDSR
jgi:hypothetical protein